LDKVFEEVFEAKAKWKFIDWLNGCNKRRIPPGRL